MKRGRPVAGLALALWAAACHAHTRSQSHSMWEISATRVDVMLTFPTIEGDRLATEDAPITDERLKAYLTERVYPSVNGQRCPVLSPIQTVAAIAGFRKYELTFRCARLDELTLHFSAFFDRVKSHTDFAQVENTVTDEFTEQLMTSERQSVQITGAGATLQNAHFTEFVHMGIMHILTGIDHMSFLLGLVLISQRLRDLVFVVTGFTLGHSLTLALAVSGVLRPHAEYIDALVALTIALIGAENIVVQTRQPAAVALTLAACMAVMALLHWLGYGDLPALLLLGAGLFAANYLMMSGRLGNAGRLRMVITLVFGLIHGFGFAADLLELQLPTGRLAQLLVGFNLGVELGQLALVFGVTLLVALLRQYRWALPRPLVVDVASACLVGLGVFWFVSRSYG